MSESQISGRVGAAGVVAGILLLVLAIGAPAWRAPASARAERDVLVEDRVVDGVAPVSAAWTAPRGPLATRPLTRVVLRGEDVAWAGNPAGYRLGGWLGLALAACALAATLRLAGGRGLQVGLAIVLLLTSPAAVACALWFPARGDVLGLALGASAALLALRSCRLEAAGEDGGTELVAAALVGVAAAGLAPTGLVAPIAMLGLALSAVALRPWRLGLVAVSILVVAAALAHAGGGAILDAGELAGLPGRLAARLAALAPGAQGLPGAPGDIRGWTVLGIFIVVAELAARVAARRDAPGAARGVRIATLGILVLVAVAPSVGSRSGGAPEALPALLWFAGVGAFAAGRSRWLALALAAIALASAGDSILLSPRMLRPAHAFELSSRRAPASVEASLLLAHQRVLDGDQALAVQGLAAAIDSTTSPSRLLQLELVRMQADLASELVTSGARMTADGLLADASTRLAALAAGASRDEQIDSALIGARLALLAEPTELRRALELLTQADSRMPAGDERQRERLLLLGHVRSAYASDDAAGQAYRQALALDPASFEICYHLGNFLVSRADERERAGDLESAARFRQEAISLLERAWSSRALDQGGALGRLLVVQLGGNYGKVGMGLESRVILEEGLALWPDDPRLLFNHALTLIGTPSTQVRGETEMQRALELARQRGLLEADYFESILSDHLVRRGNALIEAGQVDECERLASLAVEVSPTNFSAQVLLGDVRFAQARFDEALLAYAQALSLGGDSIAARVKYYHAMRQRGMVALLRMSSLKVESRKQPERAGELCAEYELVKKQAISDLRGFLENLPGDEKAEDTRSRLASLANARCEEEERSEPTPLEDETAALIRQQLAAARERYAEGMTAFAAGDFEQAARSFQSATSLFSREPRFHLMRARALVELPGEEGKALFAVERALVLDVKVEVPEILFHAGGLAARVAALPELPEQVAILFPGVEGDAAVREALRERAIDRLNMYIRLAPAGEVMAERARGLLLDLRDH